jgi:methylmalonyl-CoA epimerase
VFDRIDHIGVAVEDLDAAIELYRDRLGMREQHRETVEEQGVDAVLLEIGDAHVELLSPLGPETAVGRFLERRGPGLHHVALRVDEPLDELLPALEAAGFDAVGPIEPSSDGRPCLFLHPSTTGGVLVELVEGPPRR